jgi:hypothetical protein
MLSVAVLDTCRSRAAETALLGQICGIGIHHATPLPILAVAITMVCAPLFAALVLVPSSTKGLPPGGFGAFLRAILAALSSAVLADYEIAVTPPALELGPGQHQFPAENWARRSKRGRVGPQLRLTPRPWKTRWPCDGTAGSSSFLSARDRGGRRAAGTNFTSLSAQTRVPTLPVGVGSVLTGGNADRRSRARMSGASVSNPSRPCVALRVASAVVASSPLLTQVTSP